MKHIAVIALSATACRGGDDDDDGGGARPDGGGVPGSTTIYDVQSEDMPVGTAVALDGVVVTAIDAYGGRTGGIYVMEPDGGPYSGVFVFLSGTQAADLAPGDLVDITGGVKVEFALQEDETGRTLTEVSAAEGGTLTVTKVGEGTVPAPEVVTPWELAASDDEAEKWEGVLVEFQDVRVHSAPFNVSSSDETLKEMTVTGPFRVSSSLTALGEEIERDACYGSVVGIGDYFFSYKILPRSAADLTLGDDADCLPSEAGDALCGDDSDNDYDGFLDCEDVTCRDAEVACPLTEASVTDLQDGTVAAETRVRLTGVTVTAKDTREVDSPRKYFWVQDGLTAGQNNGLFVYLPNSAELPDGVAEGATVDLDGTIIEYACGGNCSEHPLTQLTGVEVTLTAAPGDLPAPVTVASHETLASDTAGEPYEGVLVRLENVRVVEPEVLCEGQQCGRASIGSAGTPLIIEDDIYRWWQDANLAAGQCLASVTGVLHRNTFDGTPIVLMPRKAADVDTSAGSCD